MSKDSTEMSKDRDIDAEWEAYYRAMDDDRFDEEELDEDDDFRMFLDDPRDFGFEDD